MIWNLEKLEQERLDLIEVIDNLKRWERFSIDDRERPAKAFSGIERWKL